MFQCSILSKQEMVEIPTKITVQEAAKAHSWACIYWRANTSKPCYLGSQKARQQWGEMFALAAGGPAGLYWEQVLLTWTNTMLKKKKSSTAPIHLQFGNGQFLNIRQQFSVSFLYCTSCWMIFYNRIHLGTYPGKSSRDFHAGGDAETEISNQQAAGIKGFESYGLLKTLHTNSLVPPYVHVQHLA